MVEGTGDDADGGAVGGGADLRPDADGLLLGDEPAGAVEAVECQRVLELALRAGTGEDPAVGGGDDGGAVEEPHELLAQVFHGAAGEDDLHQDPVDLLEPVEHGGLVVEQGPERLGVELVAGLSLGEHEQREPGPLGGPPPGHGVNVLGALHRESRRAGLGKVGEEPRRRGEGGPDLLGGRQHEPVAHPCQRTVGWRWQPPGAGHPRLELGRTRHDGRAESGREPGHHPQGDPRCRVVTGPLREGAGKSPPLVTGSLATFTMKGA